MLGLDRQLVAGWGEGRRHADRLDIADIGAIRLHSKPVACLIMMFFKSPKFFCAKSQFTSLARKEMSIEEAADRFLGHLQETAEIIETVIH